MELNNSKKFIYLDQEYFSTGTHYAYEFEISGRWYTINLDDSTGNYVLFTESRKQKDQFSTIYA